MRKYTIEVNEECVTKTFIDGDREYQEVWKRTEHGSETTAASITSQMEESGLYVDEEELLDILDSSDLDDLWDYLEDEI